jgi:hypothetical protein
MEVNRVKILVSGPVHSGKSSYISYIDKNSLNISAKGRDNKFYTVGIDIGSTVLKNIRVSLFGTPGLLQFSTIRDIVAKGADGVIFIFDAAHPEKDEQALTILNHVRSVIESNIPIVFLANKQDLDDARPPEVIKAQNTLSNMAKIFPTSCKTGLNIKESLNFTVKEIVKNYKELLKTLEKYESNIKGLASELSKDKDEMRDFLNSLEIKEFIEIDRGNRTYKVNKDVKSFV